MKSLRRNFILPIVSALAFLPLAHLLAGAADLPAGTAKGSFVPEDKKTPATLTNSAAFVDVKDDRSPVILILSDKKLPTEKWTSEFDMMRENVKFSGVAFWIDKEGSVFRMATYDNGREASVSGYFELKLEGAFGKNLAGAVVTSDPAGTGPKADATFHVILK